MNPTNDLQKNLPPLPRGMYWLGDGTTAERAGLTEAYSERLRMTNLVRLTKPGTAMHERARVRIAAIHQADAVATR
jgi:hypothetical protein